MGYEKQKGETQNDNKNHNSDIKKYNIAKENKLNYKNARKQNVSIGIEFNGFDIDVVPARKDNSTSYVVNWQRYNDHYLWSNKRQNRMLTNIQKHIDLVRNSGIIDEIVLFKVWKQQKGIDFPFWRRRFQCCLHPSKQGSWTESGFRYSH